MKLEKLIEVAISAERIPADVAEELLEYGVTAFLSEGLSYPQVMDILARAEIATCRRKTQQVSFPG